MIITGLNIILIFLILTLAIILLFEKIKINKLSSNRNTLLQEKEATLGFVQNVGEVFTDAETVDTDLLLERVLHYAVRTCKAGSGVIYLLNPDKKILTVRAVSGVFPPLFEIDSTLLKDSANPSNELRKILMNRKLNLGETLIGEVAIQGGALHIEDAEMDVRIPQLPIDFLSIRSLLLAPMRFGNDVIGVMVLANRTGHSRFAASDLSLAQALAAQASVPIHYADLQETLEEKRQLDRDMQIAQQIQSSLLPQDIPQISNIDIATFNHPALDIGGDYYDFIQIDKKHIGIVIADVSGKGIGGALMMAVCRSVLQTNAKNKKDPSEVLIQLNDTLSSNLAEDMFISMLYMILNTDTYHINYARAGHEPPIILHRESKEIDREETDGIAIGLVDAPTFSSIIKTKEIQLKSGDLVITYTDGITEAMNNKGEEWGLDQLIKTINDHSDNSATNLLNRIEDKVLGFTGDTNQYDDMTMVAINIL